MNDAGKLEPPKLFGRKKASKPPAEAAQPDAAGVAATPPVEPVVERPDETPATVPVEPVVERPDETPGVPAEETMLLTTPEITQQLDPPAQPRVRRTITVPGVVAAAIAGLVAGVVLSGLTWAAHAATDPADSGRIQAVMLVAIFVLSVVAGALTLRLLKVASPGTIAFLGSALVAVVAVVALSNHLNDAVGFVAGVVLSVLAYPLSRWVTVRYIDTAGMSA